MLNLTDADVDERAVSTDGPLVPAVVMAGDGRSRQSPIHPDTAVLVIHHVCSFIGLPLNLFVAAVILRLKRMNSKPRNIVQLGLIFSNLFAYLPILIEFAYLYMPSPFLCQMYVAVVGLPYVVFLVNLIIALLDRYTAMAHQTWHKKRVTVRWVVAVQLLASLSVAVVYKFPYVSHIVPLECEIQMTQVRLITAVLFVLFILCVIGQLVVYLQIRRLLRRFPTVVGLGPLDSSGTAARRALVQQQTQGKGSSSTSDFEFPLPVHLNWMEMEVTRNVITGVTTLFIVTGPFLAFTTSMVICRMIGRGACNSFVWLAPYFKELPLIHSVYQPAMYIRNSKEFRSALRSRMNI